MADKNTFQLMAREGVIWGLSSLALLDHFELSQMCAQALCRYVRMYDMSGTDIQSTDYVSGLLSDRIVLTVIMKK